MTKDDIIKLARKSWIDLYGLGKDRQRFFHRLEAFAALVAAFEREACAKVAAQFELDEKTSYVMYASKAISARGNT